MKQLAENIRNTVGVCRYFYAMAGKKKGSYAFLIITDILLSSFAPIKNIIMPKFIIDELMGAKDKTKLLVYVLIIVSGNFFLSMLIKILQEVRGMQEDELARSFDMMMSEKSMSMKYENTEKEEVLSARQKAETGMSWYSGGIAGMSGCVCAIGKSLCLMAGVIVIIVKVSPVLLPISLIAVIVNSFCTSKINAASAEVFAKTPAINKFYTYIYTRITKKEYAKELRLYDASDLVTKKSVENADALNKMDNECAIKQFKWGIPGSVFSALTYGISYCYLGIMALNGEITISELVMCISAVVAFSNDCLLSILNNTQLLMLKCHFMSAFLEYMKTGVGSEEKNDSIVPGTFDGIVFEHVSFKYPGTDEYVIKDINMKINPGESLSIVGLNGAGKSSLVKLICRLYNVTEGEIKVCGKNILEYSPEEYRKLISVVFQDFKLFGYSLDENIRMGKEYDKNDKHDLSDIYRLSGIADWIKTLEAKGDTLIGKEYDEHGIEASGGQAQKIAIARALYRGSDVVILDEPTAALDPVAEYDIYKHFNELVHGRTAIYISHRMSSCRFCDRIIVIADKTIKESGTHDELIAKGGIYKELFSAQAKWYGERIFG